MVHSVRLLSLLLLGASCWVSIPEVLAQEALPRRGNDFARNSIFLELAGNGVLYSLNYDHKFFDHASARIGGMYLSLPAEDDLGNDGRISVLLVPIMVNYLVGNGNSRLELGAGALVGAVNSDTNNEAVNAVGAGGIATTVGYRLQPRKGGFLFRIGITPFITGEGFQLWGGLSLGGTF